MVSSRNLIHLVLCLSVAQSATDVLILEIGYVTGGHAPVFVDLPSHPGPTVDAIMQALSLTDVVLGAAVPPSSSPSRCRSTSGPAASTPTISAPPGPPT